MVVYLGYYKREVVRVELSRKHENPRVKWSVIRLQCSEYPGVIVSVELEELMFVKFKCQCMCGTMVRDKYKKSKLNKHRTELLLFWAENCAK